MSGEYLPPQKREREREEEEAVHESYAMWQVPEEACILLTSP